MYKSILAILGAVIIPLSSSFNEKYQTGYMKPDTEYPLQPTKLIELENIVIVQFSGKQAYPLRVVCEALDYNVAWSDGIIVIHKEDETHIVDTKSNPELKIIDGTSYALSSLFNRLFGVSFRYLEDIEVLGIFT